MPAGWRGIVLARADEIVVVTPSLDRERRRDSYVALAEAWRRAA